MYCNAFTLLTAMRINAFNALTQKRSFFTTHNRQNFQSRPSWFISWTKLSKINKIGSELERDYLEYLMLLLYDPLCIT